MIHNPLLRIATSTLAATAIVEGPRLIPYAALQQSVDTLSHHLRGHGLQSGQTVAVRIPNSAEAVIAILACARLDLRILLLDPSLKSGELELYFRKVTPTCLLESLSSVATTPEGLLVIRIPSAEALMEKPHSCPQVASSSSRGGFLLLSSGTTGTPKVVFRTFQQAEAALQIFNDTIPLSPDDNVLGVLPFFHSFGLLFVLLSTLKSGAKLHLAPFSPRATISSIETSRITVLPASPFMFRMLTETPCAKPPDGSSLRLAISAGSALPLAVASGFRARFGIGIHQSYGTTETGPAALGNPRFDSNQGGCIGKPYVGVHFEFHCLAQNDSHPDPRPHERPSLAIAVRSPANAVGYLNDPEISETVFRNGAVYTGDVGYRSPEGDIFVLGRERPMLNVAGKKVAPAEVEACLRTHPCVADVAIIGIPAPGGDQKIKAVIVKSGPVTDLEIRQFCAERLADFKIPREISFEENLSRGPMGKTKLS